MSSTNHFDVIISVPAQARQVDRGVLLPARAASHFLNEMGFHRRVCRLGGLNGRDEMPRAAIRGLTRLWVSRAKESFEETSASPRTMGEARSIQDAPSRCECCRESLHRF